MKKIFLCIFFMQLFVYAFAQTNDEQVVALVKEAQQQGKGQEEILLMLTQQGVSKEQMLRIKDQYTNSQQQSQQSTVAAVTDRARTELPVEIQKERETIQAQAQDRVNIFGHNIFNNKLLTFEPNLNIATPENYILGPGDEVIIDIWGDTEKTFRQSISPEGTVTISEVGPIYLSGSSIKEANTRLKNAFARIYATMSGSNPSTLMRLSLGEIRSIRVNVMGEVMIPGTYTLSSLASLFHALYNAGGINSIGSLRSIKLNRGGKELANIDVYEYLLEGKSSLDMQLQDGDVIIIPPYQNIISLSGKVKRPLSYEMQDGETIHDLLDYAGGFTGDAYKEVIQAIRKSGQEYRMDNVSDTDFKTFILTDGDEISVSSMINRFENRVEISGAVFRAKAYALSDNVTSVKQLIAKAGGVREDAFLNRAVLHREKADRTLEVISIDIKSLLGGEVEDIKLQKNDRLLIPSIFDLQDDYTVNIGGAVRSPGNYPFATGMSIEDVVIQAGGLQESASVVKIDISRRIKDPKGIIESEVLAENHTLTLKDGLIVDGEKDFTLMPFDQIIIRQSPSYHTQQNVIVQGQALYAGTYTLSKKGERLSDLVKKAGGVTSDAYIQGARLIRQLNTSERVQVEAALEIAKRNNKDSIDVSSLELGEVYFVGIELSKALEYPGSEYDVVLREGDILRIPTYIGTVKISGTVMYPNTVVYKKGGKLKHYINQAGGYGDRAKKRKAFIIYLNGTVSKAKSFGRTRIEPGCEIIVPIKSVRKGVSLTEVMSLASSTTSMAAMVTSIMNMTK